jgi:hypothetical protein
MMSSELANEARPINAGRLPQIHDDVGRKSVRGLHCNLRSCVRRPFALCVRNIGMANIIEVFVGQVSHEG